MSRSSLILENIKKIEDEYKEILNSVVNIVDTLEKQAANLAIELLALAIEAAKHRYFREEE